MIRVKVCGMVNPLNVKEIAEAEPDFMGLYFYPGSPRYVGEEPEIRAFPKCSPGIQKGRCFP